jgi:hypothetical protein
MIFVRVRDPNFISRRADISALNATDIMCPLSRARPSGTFDQRHGMHGVEVVRLPLLDNTPRREPPHYPVMRSCSTSTNISLQHFLLKSPPTRVFLSLTDDEGNQTCLVIHSGQKAPPLAHNLGTCDVKQLVS